MWLNIEPGIVFPTDPSSSAQPLLSSRSVCAYAAIGFRCAPYFPWKPQEPIRRQPQGSSDVLRTCPMASRLGVRRSSPQRRIALRGLDRASDQCLLVKAWQLQYTQTLTIGQVSLHTECATKSEFPPSTREGKGPGWPARVRLPVREPGRRARVAGLRFAASWSAIPVFKMAYEVSENAQRTAYGVSQVIECERFKFPRCLCDPASRKVGGSDEGRP
jgi:hypothetical protein